MKKIILSILLSLFITSNALAASSTVSFENGAENFVFHPSSSSTNPTDLFSNLKNIMPGDTITDEIEIINHNTNFNSVKLYLRSVPHDDTTNPLSPEVAATETISSMEEFLSNLTLKVINDGEVIYDSTSTASTENIPLGEFKSNEKAILTIELSAPITLSSDYMHRIAEIDWIFTAETPDNLPVPDTGLAAILDTKIAFPFIILIGASIVVAVIILYIIIRKQKFKKVSKFTNN